MKMPSELKSIIVGIISLILVLPETAGRSFQGLSLSRQDAPCRPNLFPNMQNPGTCVSMDTLESCNQEFSSSVDCSNGFCCYQPQMQAPPAVVRRRIPDFSPADHGIRIIIKLKKKAATTAVTVPVTDTTNPPATEPVTETTTSTTPFTEAVTETSSETTTSTETTTTISETTSETPTSTSSENPPATEKEAEKEKEPEKEALPQVNAMPEPVLGQSCSNNDECPDSGTTCTNGQCKCWWDQGFAAARAWACNTDQQCTATFPNHVCRPTKLCNQFSGRSGFCIPIGALH